MSLSHDDPVPFFSLGFDRDTDIESISESPFLLKAFDPSPSLILTDGNSSLVALTSKTRTSSDRPIDRRSGVRSSYKRPAAPRINRNALSLGCHVTLAWNVVQ
jgi:hypothetical protein